MVEIAFNSIELRTICESEAHAKTAFGAQVAEVLKHRLADIRAATSINDLIAGKPRIIDGKDQHMAIDLCNGYRIVICANHLKNPTMKSGRLNWSKVSRVKILQIERDYD